MADFDSSLPVRTQQNGDVVIFMADPTTPSQLAAVDSFGSQNAIIRDASGNAVTSQANGSQRALDVGINVAGVQIDPRSIRALTAADVITAQQGTSPWITQDNSDGPAAPGTAASFSSLAGAIYNATPPVATDGQQLALQVDANGRLLVDANIVDTRDTNYGVVGANTVRSASQIGNATGAADFNYGTVGAQTLRVASQIGNASGSADFGAGSTSAQTLRVQSNQGAPASLANAWPVLPTDGTNSQSYTAAGEAKVSITQPIPAGSNLIGAVNIDIGGSPVSATNPVPVTVEDAPGTHINAFKDAAAIAVGSSDNHDYTVTAGKTLHLNQLEAAASGKAKMTLQIETGVATGVFNSIFVQFNSTAETNFSIHLDDDILVAAGVRVRVIMLNRDLAAQDLYSTICGYEV